MRKETAAGGKLSQGNPLFTYILILIFFVFIVLFSTFKVSGDDDIFWHLETGKYIVENRSIPSSDVFGYVTAGQRWIPFEWGWDVVSYVIFSFSGFNGLSIFRTLIFIAIFYFYIRLIKKQNLNIPLSLLLFVVLMFGMIDRLIVKPQIISYLFFSVLLYLLISFQTFNRNKIKRLFVIPLIFLFWCNMHMGVIAGALILTIFLMTEILCYLRPKIFSEKCAPLGKKQLYQLTTIYAASMILLLANPFGLDTYLYAYSHLKMKMLEDVFEWYSPFNKVFSGTLFQYIYYFFLMCLVFTVYNSLKIRNYFFAVSAIILGIISLSSARYVIDFIVVISILTALILGNSLSSSKNRRLNSVFESRALVFVVSFFIIMFIVTLPGNSLYEYLKYSRSFGFGTDNRDYPVKMIDFIKTDNIQNVGSRPFNSFNMGGYFIHELQGKRNFIDSRNLSDDIYYKYKTVNNKLTGFERIIEEYNFDYFVWFYPGLVKNTIEINTSVVSYLINNKDKWKLIYWDDNSFLFVKNEEKFNDIIKKYEYKFVNPLYYLYDREPLKKAISENMQDVVKEIQRKYKDEPDGNLINSIARTFKVPVSR